MVVKINKIYLKSAQKKLKQVLNYLPRIIIIVAGIIITWIILLITTFSSFQIPTSSMEPVIHPGDKVIINKWIMGGRLFNIIAALNDESYSIYRLPGVSNLDRGDMIVFNYPYMNGLDSIKMNPNLYYLKRCIGLPGDTIAISDCRYIVNGHSEDIGNLVLQQRLNDSICYFHTIGENDNIPLPLQAYNLNEGSHWTIQNFGPLVIPKRGMIIHLDKSNFEMFRRAIYWETKNKLNLTPDGYITIRGDTISSYMFRENYYFAAGDNCFNSHDSRYFGFFPESFIVGKVSFKL